MDWRGKTALVTGGSRGIGFWIADALAGELGMSVMICSRRKESTEAAVRQLREQGAAAGGSPTVRKGAGHRRVARIDAGGSPTVREGPSRLTGQGTNRVVDGLECDVRDHRAVKRLVERTVERFGSIDVLVNNAGIGRFGNIVDISPDVWRDVIETNLSGVFYCCHEVVPHMRRAGRGYIVNISSLAGINAFAGGVAYNASKFALNGFSEALMQDVRYDNIRVSYILPGSVHTDFADGRHEGQEDWALHPDDVARVVVALLGHDPRSMPSRVELRPSKPPKKKQ